MSNNHDIAKIEGIGWVMRGDDCLTALMKQRGRLDWDEAYNALPCWGGLNPGDLCIDVGAFVGDSCLAMLRAKAEVIAIECQPDAFECLTRNCPEADCRMMAVGDGSESVALLPNTGGNTGGRWVVRGGNVPTVPIDRIVAGRVVRLVKLDIEGYEVAALRGMAETIARCSPVVIVEINLHALENFGFTEDDVWALLPGYSKSMWANNAPGLFDYICRR